MTESIQALYNCRNSGHPYVVNSIIKERSANFFLQTTSWSFSKSSLRHACVRHTYTHIHIRTHDCSGVTYVNGPAISSHTQLDVKVQTPRISARAITKRRSVARRKEEKEARKRAKSVTGKYCR